MQNFTLHHLRVETIVETPLILNEHKGSAVRGALYHALRGPNRPGYDGYTGFCVNKAAASCYDCPLHAICPVSTLVATLDEESERGRNVPRPYIIRVRPDKSKLLYQPGTPFTFDLALCADALPLFPYVVMALQRLQVDGLGKKGIENEWHRGRVRLERISTIHPLTGEMATIQNQGETTIKIPDFPATHADVMAATAQLPRSGPLTFQFHSPTRLIEHKQLLKEPTFRPLFLRLITRLEELSGRFSDTPLELDVPTLVVLAEKVQLVQNQTYWVELESYSTRKGGSTPIGGLMGQATYHADNWQPFLPWLVWGSLVGVGKNTVKGDGWYTLEAG